MSYIYHGQSGFNSAIVGKVWDGCVVEEKDVQPGALDGLVKSGKLTVAKPAKITTTSPEEDKS